MEGEQNKCAKLNKNCPKCPKLNKANEELVKRQVSVDCYKVEFAVYTPAHQQGAIDLSFIL